MQATIVSAHLVGGDRRMVKVPAATAQEERDDPDTSIAQSCMRDHRYQRRGASSTNRKIERRDHRPSAESNSSSAHLHAHRHMALRVEALVQLRPAIDQSSVEIVLMRWQHVPDAIKEPHDNGIEDFKLVVIGRKPGSECPEPRIIPPLRVKTRLRADDLHDDSLATLRTDADHRTPPTAGESLIPATGLISRPMGCYARLVHRVASAYSTFK